MTMDDAAPSRRDFLRMLGASMAAGLAGCDGPPPEAIPYARQPEGLVPGKPRWYATATLFEGHARPVLAETHMGRPTKLDGNPGHPAASGASDAFMQASVMELYDPDRSHGPVRAGAATSWDEAMAMLERLDPEGLRILTGPLTSPSLARLLGAAAERGAEWHSYAPVGLGNRPAAARLAFGRAWDVHYRLERARVIVTLDDDLFGPGLDQLRHSAAWAEARAQVPLPVIHAAESTPGLVGAQAHRRLATAPSRMGLLAAALARAAGVAATGGGELRSDEAEWAEAAGRALLAHVGASLLAVGPWLPPEVIALGHLVNARLGNAGTTLAYTEPVVVEPGGGLAELVAEMAAGRVETLLVIGANPAYDAPADLAFAEALGRVGLSVHVGLYRDETAAACQWHLPLAHPLESWGDARALDGTASILQPLVGPLFNGRSALEVLALLTGRRAGARELVAETWRAAWGEDKFDEAWRQALHSGFVAGTAAAEVAVFPSLGDPVLPGPAKGVEAVFRPDPSIWDGSFANNGWLQELPRPLTKLTWDNIVALGPGLARRLGLGTGDLVTVEAGGRAISGPAWLMHGQDEDTVTLYLGYGRRRAGRFGTGVGYDAYALRQSAAPWHLAGVALRPEGRRVPLAATQHHFTLDGRDLVRRVAAGGALAPPVEPASLYPDWPYPAHAWGMVIDLDLCTGCNACVVACQAENSIPVVGSEEVRRGREMHWLRVDRYYEGGLTHFLPVPCMHCEKAPCEAGCPVNATVHGPEGLNQMVYNRCIGTRTCSSYCPYKVRRFNYFAYAHQLSPIEQAQLNPDVTVRGRGVMEKCTYCVQRISAARIEARKQNRRIRDGEVTTACQDACPSRAIVFGDLNDPGSAVARAAASRRRYSLLEHLGTRPRTSYLARRVAED